MGEGEGIIVSGGAHHRPNMNASNDRGCNELPVDDGWVHGVKPEHAAGGVLRESHPLP